MTSLQLVGLLLVGFSISVIRLDLLSNHWLSSPTDHCVVARGVSEGSSLVYSSLSLLYTNPGVSFKTGLCILRQRLNDGDKRRVLKAGERSVDRS
jgi:hypothetical protein